MTRAHGRGESDYSSLWAGWGGELSERIKRNITSKRREKRGERLVLDRHRECVIGDGAIVMRR